MTRITTLALLLILLSPTACVRRALAPTFAKVFRGIIAAQIEDRSSRPLAPLKGDEAKRIIRTYYSGLTGDNSGGQEQGASSNISSTQLPPGPTSGSTNPFAFKVR